MKGHLLNSTMRFGKYQGQSVADVLFHNPTYLSWCLINVDHFFISDLAMDGIRTAFPEVKFTVEAEAKRCEKQVTWLDIQHNKAALGNVLLDPAEPDMDKLGDLDIYCGDMDPPDRDDDRSDDQDDCCDDMDSSDIDDDRSDDLDSYCGNLADFRYLGESGENAVDAWNNTH